MTLEQADFIMKEYGKFLEHVDCRLTPMFVIGKPESVLPFPKQVIEESLGIMASQFYNIGDVKTVSSIEACLAALASYIPDEEALIEAVDRISDQNYREKFTIPLWENIQNRNLKKLN